MLIGYLRIPATSVLLLLFVSAAVGQNPGTSVVRISLDQAIDLALARNHSIKAARSQIPQSQAQEITANLRPNPVLAWDSQFIPLFNPSAFSITTLDQTQQFDLGIGYLLERGKKRQHRLQAARDQTSVTRSQVGDVERTTIFNAAQQFINAQLAESNLQLALEALNSFRQTVEISAARYKAGDISEADFLKIKLQLLQFQTDVSAAKLARVQALSTLRQLLGYEAVPQDYDVEGEFTYKPLSLNLDELKSLALQTRPDLMAAQRGIAAAQSQFALARANGKRDLNASFNYSHISGLNTGAFFFNMQLPIFDRNQGERARTRYAITQSQEAAFAASDTVLSDVTNAYEAVETNQEVVKIYASGYLQQSSESRDISEYAYKRGAASLLDFLDAQRSYRSTQLAYRQALAAYMTAVEQLRAAVGTRNLP
jgi:outer membrane protein, heavy metal efflux system